MGQVPSQVRSQEGQLGARVCVQDHLHEFGVL